LNFRKALPNLFTSLNLLSGCIGIVFITSGNLHYAPYFVWVGGFFDFLDGFSARLLKVSSPIGKELDSLADMVTFGVLPSFVVYEMLNPLTDGWLPYVGFLIAIFSALRLAKFNVDTLQSEVFIGMPVPANAVFFSGLTMFTGTGFEQSILSLPGLLAITVLFSLTMVSPLKFIAIKFKSLSWNGNEFKYVFLLGSAIILLIGGVEAASAVIIWYILTSLLGNAFSKL